MTLRSFLGLLAALFALVVWAQCAATAPASDLQALIASAERSPSGKALVARALAQTPTPSNYELAGIKSDLNKVLAQEVSASVAAPASAVAAPAARSEAAPLWGQPIYRFMLIAVVVMMGVKLLLVALRPRGPY